MATLNPTAWLTPGRPMNNGSTKNPILSSYPYLFCEGNEVALWNSLLFPDSNNQIEGRAALIGADQNDLIELLKLKGHHIEQENVPDGCDLSDSNNRSLRHLQWAGKLLEVQEKNSFKECEYTYDNLHTDAPETPFSSVEKFSLLHYLNKKELTPVAPELRVSTWATVLRPSLSNKSIALPLTVDLMPFECAVQSHPIHFPSPLNVFFKFTNSWMDGFNDACIAAWNAYKNVAKHNALDLSGLGLAVRWNLDFSPMWADICANDPNEYPINSLHTHLRKLREIYFKDISVSGAIGAATLQLLAKAHSFGSERLNQLASGLRVDEELSIKDVDRVGMTGLLDTIRRLPFDQMLFSFVLDRTGTINSVGGASEKKHSHIQAGLDGPFVACPNILVSRPLNLKGLPAGSRLIKEGESFVNVIEELGKTYRLNLTAIRLFCASKYAKLIEAEEGQAYRKKYDKDLFVRRPALDQYEERLIQGDYLPVMFVTAESGMGKTCYVRNLYERLLEKEHCIPLLVRGNGGGKGALELSVLIKELTDAVVGVGDREVGARQAADFDPYHPFDLVEMELARRNAFLVILLDGVNETSKWLEVFQDAEQTMDLITQRAAARGKSTQVRMIVTSRPERFTGWFKSGTVEAAFRGKLQFGETKELIVAELSKFDDIELESALHKHDIFDVSPELKKLLRDPLLLGFYRESQQVGQKDSNPPRTPLDLIQLHWNTQIGKIVDEADKLGIERREALIEVRDFCQILWEDKSAEALAKWKDINMEHVLARKADDPLMLFEYVKEGSDGIKSLRFRYDRLASFLIAEHCILNRDGKKMPLQAVGNTIVQAMLDVNSGKTGIERDVIRGSLLTSLSLLLEDEDYQFEAVCDEAIRILDSKIFAYQGAKDDQTRTVALHATSELIHDFFIEAAIWHGPRIITYLEGWFDPRNKNSKLYAGAVLGRVVFNLLREGAFGLFEKNKRPNSKENSLSAEETCLYKISARVLIEHNSEDPAVLLHALYREGKKDAVFAILTEAISILKTMCTIKTLFTKKMITRLRQGAQRVIFCMLLLSPEGINDPEYKECIRDLLTSLPAWLLASLSAILIGAYLKANSMPFCERAWRDLTNSKENKENLEKTTGLLFKNGWAGSSVKAAVEISTRSKNAVVTQLLSNAISCHTLFEKGELRAEIIAELGKEVDGLISAHQLLHQTSSKINLTMNEDDCAIGASAYLLSLVFYHLIVFDYELQANDKDREHDLSDADAVSIFNLMYRLADEILLQAPYLGQFQHSPSTRLETSNIIGTLGRAALTLRLDDQFISLVKKKLDAHRCTHTAFPGFFLESLATLGTLSKEPTLALNCIYEAGVALDIESFKDARHIPAQDEFDSIHLSMMMEAFLQIRAIHPFVVERFLIDKLGSKCAVPYVNHLRYSKMEAANNLSRYASWIFEHTIERIVLKQPNIVRCIKQDTFANLSPSGLGVVGANSVFRLQRWANLETTTDNKGKKATILLGVGKCCAFAFFAFKKASGLFQRRKLVSYNKFDIQYYSERAKSTQNP